MNEDTRESPVETGWFWLSSRYYSPELCRFISPDDIEYLDPESVNGLNLYCYCANDPINHVDPSGHFTIAALIISFAVNVIFEIIDDVRDGELFIDESHDWKDYLGAGISGLFGGLTPIGGNKVAKFACYMLFSVAGGLSDAALSGDLKKNGFWNTMGSITSSAIISFGIGKTIKYFNSKISANRLNKLTNNIANGKLSRMGINSKIGSNIVKNGGLAKIIRNTDGWLGNIVAEGLPGSIFGNLSSFGYSYISENLGWYF